ncbi:nesprin-1 isoform X1 [Tachysurus ichikawai]
MASERTAEDPVMERSSLPLDIDDVHVLLQGVCGTSTSLPGLSLEHVIHREGGHVCQDSSEKMLSELPQYDIEEKIRSLAEFFRGHGQEVDFGRMDADVSVKEKLYLAQDLTDLDEIYEGKVNYEKQHDVNGVVSFCMR